MKDIALPNGYKVESWYDRSTRLWITQLKDADGNQVGDAEIDGHRDGVKPSRETLANKGAGLPALPKHDSSAKSTRKFIIRSVK